MARFDRFVDPSVNPFHGEVWVNEDEHEGPLPHPAGSTTMTAAQFEISVDGVPRTYRDQRHQRAFPALLHPACEPRALSRLAKRELSRAPGAALARRLSPCPCRLHGRPFRRSPEDLLLG